MLAVYDLRQRRRKRGLRGRQKQKRFALERRNQGLLVPPGLWNTLEFRQDDSVLVVLCDRIYEAPDYVNDYFNFLSFSEPAQT
jgi:hypothetical protein